MRNCSKVLKTVKLHIIQRKTETTFRSLLLIIVHFLLFFYELIMKLFAHFSQYEEDLTSSFAPLDPQPNTVYEFQVRCKCDSSLFSDWSETFAIKSAESGEYLFIYRYLIRNVNVFYCLVHACLDQKNFLLDDET